MAASCIGVRFIFLWVFVHRCLKKYMWQVSIIGRFGELHIISHGSRKKGWWFFLTHYVWCQCWVSLNHPKAGNFISTKMPFFSFFRENSLFLYLSHHQFGFFILKKETWKTVPKKWCLLFFRFHRREDGGRIAWSSFLRGWWCLGIYTQTWPQRCDYCPQKVRWPNSKDLLEAT